MAVLISTRPVLVALVGVCVIFHMEPWTVSAAVPAGKRLRNTLDLRCLYVGSDRKVSSGNCTSNANQYWQPFGKTGLKNTGNSQCLQMNANILGTVFTAPCDAKNPNQVWKEVNDGNIIKLENSVAYLCVSKVVYADRCFPSNGILWQYLN